MTLLPPHGARGDAIMVASGHPFAAETALQILQQGGSAIDAAIAADAILGVVEPMATGIGGDLLAMIVPPDGAALTYNGTGRAPRGLDAERVAALPGRRIPDRHPLSLTVPGAVRGWFDLHARFGRLDMAQLLAPAIALARRGFAVAPICAREWTIFEGVIARDPVAAALYRAGKVPQAGDIFANPELADLLAAIATKGPDAYYRGLPAEAAEKAAILHGGALKAADFDGHAGHFDIPLSTRFRGLDILECPPNTHGLAVLEALAALEPLALDPGDPRTMIEAVAAMGQGLATARKTVADPAGNTVCTVVVDQDGLAVTLMSSIFKRFGSGIGVPGCGFVLQNRGSGFAEPGHINGPAPGKRPYHTVIPAAALKDGRFHAGLGVVGGAMQPQGHVQLLLRIAAWGEPLQAALDAPRWRLEGKDELAIEPGTPDALVRAFQDAGYREPTGGEIAGRSDFGGAQIVVRASDGSLRGASDKRKDGTARGA
ncbi:gamma-glutamyltransferase [Kaistia algarum]|uniref:gamma-glutamyltransferase family protein n=1 Tax=Kaistia algarum TaxID=2083279 RepID=UPI000CE7EC60|nr:gamma-glutamyltransferase [Kaistia algarum]MCX5511887.1 gamma-glutamyltransferase [Kaistia algarum]PPE80025.1 gamma-glutamyltransferase [Kaistia algarum]